MAEVSEEINRSDTICHYKRFYGFLRANYNACRVGFLKMVDLLRLFAEYGLEHNAAGFSHSRTVCIYCGADPRSAADALAGLSPVT